MLVNPITIGREKKIKKMAPLKVREANRINNRKKAVFWVKPSV